jgi:hypothetical protein
MIRLASRYNEYEHVSLLYYLLQSKACVSMTSAVLRHMKKCTPQIFCLLFPRLLLVG